MTSLSSAIDRLLSHSDDPRELETIIRNNSAEINDTYSVVFPCRRKSVLMMAAKYGRLQCCESIISKYPQCLMLKNGQKFTALHFACYEGHQSVSFYLLRSGADPFERNVYGETCVEAAMQGGHEKLAKELELQVTAMAYPNQGGVSPCDSDYVTNDLSETISAPQHCYEDTKEYVMEVISCDRGAGSSIVGSKFNITWSPSSLESIGIGRSRSNRICLLDLSVSKLHASLIPHPLEGFYIRDLGSVHKTHLNGCLVKPSLELDRDNCETIRDSGILKVGRVSLKLNIFIRPAVLSSGFVPNPALGTQLLEITKMSHIIKSIRPPKRNRNEGVSVSQKNYNKVVIERHNALLKSDSSMVVNAIEEEDPEVHLAKKVEQGDFAALLLTKMGWTPGKGLGKTESGISDFIKPSAQVIAAGLGSSVVGNSTAALGRSAVLFDHTSESDHRAKVRRITIERYNKRLESE